MDTTNGVEIKYPCEWNYKIIGLNDELMRQAVGTVLEPDTYNILDSRTSSNGKYVSLNVQLIVFTEKERNQYYHDLGKHKDIKMVL